MTYSYLPNEMQENQFFRFRQNFSIYYFVFSPFSQQFAYFRKSKADRTTPAILQCCKPRDICIHAVHIETGICIIILALVTFLPSLQLLVRKFGVVENYCYTVRLPITIFLLHMFLLLLSPTNVSPFSKLYSLCSFC